MNELARLVEHAREDLHVRWDEARAARLLRGVRRKQRRRVVRRAAVSVIAIACVIASGVFLVRHRASPVPSAGVIALRDGSVATAIGSDSDLQLVDSSPSQVTIELRRGSGRFDVVRDKQRAFRVRVDDVIVEVLGTSFVVSREEQAVSVRVLVGRVRVMRSGHEDVVGAGEQKSFGLRPDGAEEAALVEPTTTSPHPESEAADEPQPQTSTDARPSSRWRSLAQSGHYAEAYRGLQRAGPGALRDVPRELMDAADAARLSGHSRAAVGYLRRVIEKHPDDPLAPLAAFTLGLVLLDNLGDPRAAAGYFAQTQRLAPEGTLMEDALAREVEAWSKAGAPERARARAEQYVARYPKGMRLHAVRSFGGLE